MRWNVMGCAGNTLVSTPHLDRLAHEGTRFATAYTVAAICTPSRYSFFTSRYAHVHGSTDNSTLPQPGQLLLPALLQHYGYETAISGKLHFLPPQPAYGFDYFWSFTTEGPGQLPRWPEYMDAKHGRASARRVVPDSRPFPDDPLGKDYAKLPYPPGDMQTSWITDRAIEYLGRRDPARPYFLFVSYLDPHSPSHLSEPYFSMYQDREIPLPATFRAGAPPLKRGAADGGEGAGRHEVNNPDIVRKLTAAYYAKMKLVDDNVGRLLAALEQKGEPNNTLVIFTADHGNMLGDHNKWFKGVMYEGSSRIPLLIKAPANSPYAATFNRGRVVPEIVENIDVMPTLLEMVGRPLPGDPGFQGRSMVRLVAGEEPTWKNIAHCERLTSMVRTAQYKLISNGGRRGAGGGDFELYDLAADPQETRNLAGDPAHAAVQRELQAKLEAWAAHRPAIPKMAGVQTAWNAGVSDTPAPPARQKRERPARR